MGFGWPTLPNHAQGMRNPVSERVDIQRSFVTMFMDEAGKLDPGSATSTPEKKPRVEFDGRTKQLENIVKRKIRAASYTSGGQDWSVLFKHQDRDGSGDLGRREFFKAVRLGAGVQSNIVGDKDLDKIYQKIDADADGGLTIDEFISWVKYTPEEKALENMGKKLSLSEKMEMRNGGSQPVREFVVLRRCVLRAGHSLDSEVVGHLPKGEVVAVSRVISNRMKVIRLRVALPGEDMLHNGWASEKLDGGRGEPLLELLPREEWSSRYHNAGAVAGRVSLLHHTAEMAKITRMISSNSAPRSRRLVARSSSASSTGQQRRRRRRHMTGYSGKNQRVSLSELPVHSFADVSASSLGSSATASGRGGSSHRASMPLDLSEVYRSEDFERPNEVDTPWGAGLVPEALREQERARLMGTPVRRDGSCSGVGDRSRGSLGDLGQTELSLSSEDSDAAQQPTTPRGLSVSLALNGCGSAAEVCAVLDKLEKQPRQRWPTTAAELTASDASVLEAAVDRIIQSASATAVSTRQQQQEQQQEESQWAPVISPSSISAAQWGSSAGSDSGFLASAGLLTPTEQPSQRGDSRSSKQQVDKPQPRQSYSAVERVLQARRARSQRAQSSGGGGNKGREGGGHGGKGQREDRDLVDLGDVPMQPPHNKHAAAAINQRLLEVLQDWALHGSSISSLDELIKTAQAVGAPASVLQRLQATKTRLKTEARMVAKD